MSPDPADPPCPIFTPKLAKALIAKFDTYATPPPPPPPPRPVPPPPPAPTTKTFIEETPAGAVHVQAYAFPSGELKV